MATLDSVDLSDHGASERIQLSPPDVGEAERQAMLRAFDSGWIAPLGPEVDGFEAELADYVGAESCVTLASGTAALELALVAHGVGPGDEVVVQSATFAASAFAAAHIGARPVFIDSEWATWNLDPDLLADFLQQRAKVGRLPAAIMPVDLYGALADYERIEAIAARYEIPVIEDAAEALGSVAANGRRGGTFGSCGAVSFNGNKIITTSGGGAVFGSTKLTQRIRHLATQARQPVPHYEHTEIGYNARLSNLLAGIGRAQLAGLDSKITRRTEVFEHYRQALPQIDWIPDGVTKRSNHWLSVGLLPETMSVATVSARLSDAGIESRPAWKPMHAQPVFAQAEQLGGAVADEIFRRGICLPSGSVMTDGQVERVITALAQELREAV